MNKIKDWDEISTLSEKQYDELISKSDIADQVSKALTINDSFNEAYWQSISEVAHRIVNEYLKEVSLK